MYRELARKPRGTIITPRPTVVGLADASIIRGYNRTAVVQEVGRLYAAGRIERDYRLGQNEAGLWIAWTTARAPRSWWRRNGLRGSLVALVAAGALAALAWAVSALVAAVAAALPIVAGFLLVLVVGIALVAVLSGGRVIEVVQKVKIK
jgi:hypothetical protein